jgi:hypothetical protein
MKIKALIDICWRSEINVRNIDHCKAGEVCEMSDELGQQFIDSGKAELPSKPKAVKEVKVVEPVAEVKEVKAPSKKKTRRSRK